MKINVGQTNVFFCSDPHYHHSQLVRGTSQWENKKPCRPFETLERHDAQLVHNINSTVGENDILFCLGDWSFGKYGESIELAKKFRRNINCKSVVLILGNHDQNIRKNVDNIQEMFTFVRNYMEVCLVEPSKEQGVKAIKYQLVLSHYAMRTWNRAHKGSIMLYGHSHGTLDEMQPTTANPTWIGDQYYIRNYRTMDVGFDTHPEFRPYSWQEIKDIMLQRNIDLEVDHHENISNR